MRTGKRNILLTVMLLGLPLLQLNCSRTEPDEYTDGAVIRFDAGVDLLSRSTLNESTSFTDGQKFRVFGRRVGEGKNTNLFGDSGTVVTLDTSPDPDVWDYSPKQYWYWITSSNYYDFLAVHGNHLLHPATRMDIPGNLAISKEYALADDYDLLMAGTRRRGDAAARSAKVHLEFQHMLCAVRVVVINESAGVNLTLKSLSFHNLISQAKAKVTIDALNKPEFSWIDTQRPGSKAVFTEDPMDPLVLAPGDATWTALDPSDPGYVAPVYDLFIPADLTETNNGSPAPELEDFNDDMDAYMAAAVAVLPYLEVQFQSGSDPAETHRIPLKDIQTSRYVTDDPITEWERGVKYTYYITVRLDGGVIVTVITTEWDAILGETPGILIE